MQRRGRSNSPDARSSRFPEFDDDANDTDGAVERRLLPATDPAQAVQTSPHGADAAFDATFDGIEIHRQDGGSPGGDFRQHSDARRVFKGAASSDAAWRRRCPGLADFWDGITPELVAVALVYLVQGLLDITILAIVYFLKDVLGMQPAEAGLWIALSKGPWLVKPLWGFISDAFPIFGYRRRSYLIIVNLIGVAGWVGLAALSYGPASAMAFLLATNLGLAFGDVIVDAIVVEIARNEPSERAGSLQSLCWGSRAVGSIGSAAAGGWLVGLFGPRFVFMLAAVFPLGVTLSGFLISEQRVDPLHHSGPSSGGRSKALALLASQSAMLWSAVRRRSIWAPALFTFFWSAAPTADSAMFFFMSNSLHFSASFLGRVQLVQGVAELFGVWAYNRFLKRVPLRKVLGWTMVAGTFSGMTQLVLVTGFNRYLGLSDKLFALGDSVIIQALHRIALMPVFVLSARICPEGVEATLFATLMSIGNASTVTSASLGSGLTALFGVTSDSFSHLPALVVVCTLSRLLVLPLLALLPKSLDCEPDDNGVPVPPKDDVSLVT